MENLSVKDSTVNLIAGFEGFIPTAHWDYKQYSVGFGSGTMPNGSPVKAGDTVTRSQALAMLKRDAQTFANSVNQLVTASINQNQFDALVSFTYNLGAGNLGKSTLLKVVNATPNDFKAIRAEFLKWVTAGGEVLDSLKTRRSKEASLYTSGAINGGIFFLVLAVVIAIYLKRKNKR